MNIETDVATTCGQLHFRSSARGAKAKRAQAIPANALGCVECVMRKREHRAPTSPRGAAKAGLPLTCYGIA